jgi:hypothetical protein
MNTRRGCLVFALVAGCGPSVPASETPDPVAVADGDGSGGPAGGDARTAEVQKLIDAETRALAELDAKIEAAEGDALVTLHHDRAARRSFIAHLGRCQADASVCPASFDEPSLAHEKTPDAATIASVACACRTRACADWVYAQIETWDGDPDSAAAVTTARECAHDRIYGY